MTIIDNYNGESVIMFDTKGELNKIHHFYRHKGHLYLINNELKNVTVLK